MIKHAEHIYSRPEGGRHEAPAEWAVIAYWPRDRLFVMPSATATSPVVDAYVNHGRWVVDCPFCMSAQVTSAEDRRFFCTECLNAGVDGKWIRVSWPKHHLALEAILDERVDPKTRNWYPRETLKDLRAENLAYGVG